MQWLDGFYWSVCPTEKETQCRNNKQMQQPNKKWASKGCGLRSVFCHSLVSLAIVSFYSVTEWKMRQWDQSKWYHHHSAFFYRNELHLMLVFDCSIIHPGWPHTPPLKLLPLLGTREKSMMILYCDPEEVATVFLLQMSRSCLLLCPASPFFLSTFKIFYDYSALKGWDFLTTHVSALNGQASTQLDNDHLNQIW